MAVNSLRNIQGQLCGGFEDEMMWDEDSSKSRRDIDNRDVTIMCHRDLGLVL